MELPAPDAGRAPGAPTWQTRVVPNRYPALRPEESTARSVRGIYVSMPGYGKHEIVIDSPCHNRHHAEMSIDEVSAIIETYHRRYLELMKAHENAMILIFRNHGERAGTSLAHPHSQIIVTGVIPNHLRHREEEARRYYDDLGRCVYCDILKFELKERRRVVFENDSFLGYVPFAASVPFEVIIMPRRHAAGFGQVTETEKADLSQALRDVLARLYRKLNDPDYNYVIYTSDRFTTNEPQLHWFLDITPRLTTQAGFEIGTGININPSMPEEDADFLNQPD
jgi:UDPglucose--hexose-1-phosphate uridylyltransferase